MDSAEKKAQRTCLGCRGVGDQEQLVRYVLSPAGEVLVDYRRKLPGRGAYTCIDRNCLEKAIRRGQFARAFKRNLSSLSDELLTGELVRQVRARILGLVGMARKSGNALSGSSQVLVFLGGAESVGLVLIAGDISEGIAGKILGKARAMGVPAWRICDKQVLGQVMGKSERSVVAVKSGPLAESIKVELLRFEHIVGES